MDKVITFIGWAVVVGVVAPSVLIAAVYLWCKAFDELWKFLKLHRYLIFYLRNRDAVHKWVEKYRPEKLPDPPPAPTGFVP